MSPQQSLQKIAVADTGVVQSFTLATERHQAALSKLNAAFEKERSVALMIGEGRHEFSHVISAFLASLDDRVTYVRVKQPQSDALTAMREISRALGFEPKNLSLTDLQCVLTMFLDYQRKHRRRTVLCIEKADEQAMWLLDCIARLVNSQPVTNSSLLVVLSGGGELVGLLQTTSFEVIRRRAGSPIELAPFTLSETREFIRQKTGISGLGEIQTLFEFEAVDRIHKLSGGIPHTVARLCHQCLTIVNRGFDGPVTGKIVVKAARMLRPESAVDLSVVVVGNVPDTELYELTERLLIRSNGELIRQMPFRRGRFLVGRSKTADICIPNMSVSRRHALIIKNEEFIQILDLGSSNGTHVDGYRVNEQTLEPGALIRLGDCEIEYDVS
jgi:type II secretory pathway predicted ATPase ExeA